MIEIFNSAAIGVLFAVGIFQILRRNVIRSVIGLIILMNAVNLFLLSTGVSYGITPAYTSGLGEKCDALPQALVLTAIVISMGGTAFLLSILYILSARFKSSDMDEIVQLKN